MIVVEATVINEYGIHCRPSAIIAKAAQEYDGTITVTADDHEEADAASILGLVGMGIRCGETVAIQVQGPDEEKTARHMVELFEMNFDFPRD